MRSIWKTSNLGITLMTLSPLLALFFGWEAFFPLALTSILGAATCIVGKTFSTHMLVGWLTAELVQDLVSADRQRRDSVLGVLTAAERDWFLAELPRARAELRRRQGSHRVDWSISARWGWRLLYS